MARLEPHNSDDLLRQLDRLADADNIIRKMLKAGSPYMVRSIKRRLENHRDTGALIRSIRGSKPKKGKRSGKWYVLVAPGNGYDHRDIPNPLKMMAIEYGVKGRQPPRPFLDAAARDAEIDIIRAMQSTFDEEVR